MDIFRNILAFGCTFYLIYFITSSVLNMLFVLTCGYTTSVQKKPLLSLGSQQLLFLFLIIIILLSIYCGHYFEPCTVLQLHLGMPSSEIPRFSPHFPRFSVHIPQKIPPVRKAPRGMVILYRLLYLSLGILVVFC